MTLPIKHGFAPMEAELVRALPTGPGWQYEPKWDGFRCLAFKDGDDVYLQSKSGQDLTRYFPEVAAAVEALRPKRFLLDGELVIPSEGTLSFDDLLQRIHPAESRVKKLAAQSPAHLVVFDLLVNDRGRALTNDPLEDRRDALETFAGKYFGGHARVHLSPATRRPALAKKWTNTSGLDGIIAKRLDFPYEPGQRTAMQKVKEVRTADCVIGGFRYSAKARTVGSLLLGLYDAEGLLDHVGYTSSMPQASRRDLTRKLEKIIEEPGFTGSRPGGPSRWSRFRTNDEWKPLRPELVVEVQYDHFSGHRFRHGTKFLRWRPDKAPAQCTYDQLGPAGALAADLIPGL